MLEYLSLDISCSSKLTVFPRATFSEICWLFGTDNDKYPSIFCAKWRLLFIYLLWNTLAKFLNFNQITLMLGLNAKKGHNRADQRGHLYVFLKTYFLVCINEAHITANFLYFFSCFRLSETPLVSARKQWLVRTGTSKNLLVSALRSNWLMSALAPGVISTLMT